MYHPDCSYFLKVVDPDGGAFQLLRDMEIVPNILTLTEENASGCSFSVDENKGAIPEWTSAEEDLAAVAKAAPTAVLELMEYNEEDKSESVFRHWEGGELTECRYGRTIHADVRYDKETLSAVCEILREENLPLVAKLLEDRLGADVE